MEPHLLPVSFCCPIVLCWCNAGLVTRQGKTKLNKHHNKLHVALSVWNCIFIEGTNLCQGQAATSRISRRPSASFAGGTFVAAPLRLNICRKTPARVLLLQTLEVVQMSTAAATTKRKEFPTELYIRGCFFFFNALTWFAWAGDVCYLNTMISSATAASCLLLYCCRQMLQQSCRGWSPLVTAARKCARDQWRSWFNKLVVVSSNVCNTSCAECPEGRLGLKKGKWTLFKVSNVSIT